MRGSDSALGSAGRALVLTLGNQPGFGRSPDCRRSEYRGIVGRERDRDELATGTERPDDVSSEAAALRKTAWNSDPRKC